MNSYINTNFIDDAEKMRDFYKLTKDEFLFSYSYLTEEEYENTRKIVEQEKTAAQFVAAIKTIAAKPENLDNLESYLSHHFSEWLKKYANTPETLTAELKEFAEMEI